LIVVKFCVVDSRIMQFMHKPGVMLVVLAGAALVACGGGSTGNPADIDAALSGAPDAAPDSLLPPPPDGEGVQVALAPFEVAPGEEVYWCYTLSFPAGEVDVARIETRFGLGAHHLLISTIEGDYAEGDGRCTPNEFGWGVSLQAAFGSNLRFLSGTQTPYAEDPRSDLVLEDGMAFRFRAGTKLLAQVHWANTTDAPQAAPTVINFWYATSTTTRLLEAFFFYHTGFSIPAHAQAEVAGRCTFPSDVEVVGMVSHMHARGVNFTAHSFAGTLGDLVYEETDWQEPVMKMWSTQAGLLDVAAGEGFEYRCFFDNQSDATIVEGDSAGDEMCMLIGLYAGGDGTVFGFPGITFPGNPCVAVP
jgi:hypothetical protein